MLVDVDIDVGVGIVGVGGLQIVVFDVGYYFQCQFVMVVQEQCLLVVCGNVGCLVQDICDWEVVFLCDCYVDVWYQWEVIGYVVFVVVVEIFLDVFWLLIGFGEQQFVFGVGVEFLVQVFDDGVCFWEVFVVGVVLFVEIGNCIQVEVVDVGIELVFYYLDDGVDDMWIVEIQVGLV